MAIKIIQFFGISQGLVKNSESCDMQPDEMKMYWHTSNLMPGSRLQLSR